MGGILRWLESRSRAFVLSAAFAAIILFGLLDYLTGTEVRFFIFYWPPIAAVAWYAGRRWGLVYVVLSGTTWAISNVTDYLAQAHIRLALWNAAVNVVSFALLSLLISSLRRVVDREQGLARTDFLTGAANARAFYPILEAEIARCGRLGHPLTLAYLDLDDFKAVNDRLGHAAGDALLQTLGRSVRGELRGADTLARLGGDEFAILLPETDGAQAEAVLTRLRARLDAAFLQHGWEVGVSMGAVTAAGGSRGAGELVRMADQLMYEVKAGGKGRTLRRTLGAGALAEGAPTA